MAKVIGLGGLFFKSRDGAALQDDARRIREAAERCGRIVRTFLNMARAKPINWRAAGFPSRERRYRRTARKGPLASHEFQIRLPSRSR